MTNTITDSFYLQRFKECINNPDNRYDKVGNSTLTRWLPHANFSEHTLKVTLRDRTFSEQEYKGYQVIILGWHYEMQDVFDKSNQLTNQFIEEQDIGRLGEITSYSRYYAYVWEIGTKYDDVPTIDWLSSFAVFGGTCASDKESKTIKLAQKKLDVLAQLKQNQGVLIANANERLDYGARVNPYNVLVGDQPFVQAHGRLRKGLVIGTTGSRFIIGYVTPSNHDELKYKVVNQSQLWVKG